MSKVLVSESNLYDIADSIRAKLGTQREFTPGQMSDAIDQISGGGITVESLSVTENGTYTAPLGKAYSPVVVSVSGGGGILYSNVASSYVFDLAFISSAEEDISQ